MEMKELGKGFNEGPRLTQILENYINISYPFFNSA